MSKDQKELKQTEVELKMKMTVNVKLLKKLLPKDYKVSSSPSGLSVFIYHKIKRNESFDDANECVYNAINKLHFIEIGVGTNLMSGVRDWHFMDLDVENACVSDIKALHDHMKKFFKNWKNEYCDSYNAYDYIEKMRNMIQFDKN